MDWMLNISIFVLELFGLAAIYSVALSQEGSDFLAAKKQIIAIVLSGVLFCLMAFSNYRLLRNYSLALYIVGVCLLIAVLIFGTTIRGSTGWFTISFFSFQPVEFMKAAIVVAFATYLSARSRVEFRWRYIMESSVILMIPVFLILLQPDLGSASVLVGVWAVSILFAGLQKRQIFVLFVGAVVACLFAWQFLLADYQQARLLTFFHPAIDPLGEGYNVAQSVIAIGSGGWFGSGLGFGSQSQLKFLPEAQTDFIFAVIGEELGFVGIGVLLAAEFLLFFRLYKWARRAPDNFTAYLLIGIGSVYFIQFVINVGMNLGLFPVTGIGLPLVSYGGSSIVFLLFLLGIAQSIAMRTRWSS